MRVPAAVFLLALLCCTPALCQPPPARDEGACNTYFALAWRDWDNPAKKEWNWWSSRQTDWWTKKGQKDEKFRGLCYTSVRAKVSYVIIWYDRLETRKYQVAVPKREVTEYSGTVSIYDWGTGTHSTGSYQGRSTTTRYETQTEEWTSYRVQATVHQVVDQDGQRILGPPVFTSQHVGNWRWSKPDKDALVDCVKHISKLLSANHEKK